LRGIRGAHLFISFDAKNPNLMQGTGMEAITLERFKKKLEQMEVELRDSVERRAESTAPVQLDTSIGRLSRMEAIQSQQLALSLAARHQQGLARVRNALEAIRNGNYGRCRRCKGSIALERLEAQPDAVVCVHCATQTAR
jgi:DnaK suppressor protein